MTTSLRTSLAATGAVLLLLLTGCGAEPDTAASPAGATEPAETDGGGESPDEGDGAGGQDVDPADFADDMLAGLEAATTARVTMTVDAGGQQFSSDGQLDYTSNPPSMQMAMTMPAMSQEPLDIRLVDGVMYMNMGAMTQGKFMAIDFNDPANLPPGMEGFTDQLDPLSGLGDFEKSISQVTFVGEEDVDGEQLRHYTLTLDTSKAAGFQGLPSGKGVPAEVAYDYWVDGDFLPRRMATSMEAGKQSVSMDIRMSDWGKPVDIAAPPAKDVFDPSQAPG